LQAITFTSSLPENTWHFVVDSSFPPRQRRIAPDCPFQTSARGLDPSGAKRSRRRDPATGLLHEWARPDSVRGLPARRYDVTS